MKKSYSTKDKMKNFGVMYAGSLAGQAAGQTAGKKIGEKILSSSTKNATIAAPIAQIAGGLIGSTAGNMPGYIKHKKKMKEAEGKAMKTLANKYYGDNEKAKAIATKKSNVFTSSAGRLMQAERQYKKDLKK